MSRPPSDRALKRLVSELAAATAEDVQAVLAGLDERQRERVEALLANYLGGPVKPPRRPPLVGWDFTKIEGLSPWLLARLETRVQDASLASKAGRPATAQSGGFTMTAAAFEVLRACADGLRPDAARDATGGRRPAP